MTGTAIVTTQKVEVEGQCAWCLQREIQAFALVCPDHISQWRELLDDLQVDIRALCQAVGEFDGARPESPQMVLRICTERAKRLRAAVQEAATLLDFEANLGPREHQATLREVVRQLTEAIS